ncbi:MAG: radical SAM protein [Christensenellaceae bacterium]|nr:radical SAM protein [Christensenellaceae bacterium]
MKRYGHLVMEIMGGCNAKCKYCTTGIANLRGTPHIHALSAADFIKGLDYVLEHDFYDRENGQLELFSWGEPFLNKELNAILRAVCERKLRYRLSTNASVLQLIDRDNLPFMDDLCISISGFTPESYSRIHGLNLNKVLENIKAMAAWFRECGYDNKMVMNFHVYQFNIGEVEAAARFCEEQGIRFIPHVAYLADYDLFSSYMLGEMDAGTLREASKELMLGAVDELMKNYDPDYICKQYNALIIDEHLRVLPCAFLTSEVHLGTIFDYDTVEALDAARRRFATCEQCHQSKVFYLVNQDKYFPYRSGKTADVHVLPHCYIDAGEGYSETNTLYDRQGRVSQKDFDCRFDIPEGVRALRFDPVEGCGCLLKGLTCTDEQGRALDVVPANGERLDGGELLFRTADPQVLIPFDQAPKSVRVTAEMTLVYPETTAPQ